jgi:pimeloyl-ACP methyl ester carboxylesterase
MRGHGESKPLVGPFSVKDAADDALNILERMDRKGAIFIGQSAGTYVIQELAFRHPDRVKAMVIVGGTCITAKLSVVESLSVRMSPIALTLWPYNNP